ncbi:isatin hydrolase [Anabrus simplex]|uniref:isatin hydrolase n=1 Tax=Anabrus simplex TaxID=316456 RepID=UPI0035A274FB
MVCSLLCVLFALLGGALSCTLTAPLDLGRGLDADTVHWGTNLAFEPGELRTSNIGDTQYATNDFCSGEHTGTHLDAPFHFNVVGWTVGQIPLDRLIANGVFLNMSAEAAGNPDFLLEPQHLTQWEETNGALPDRAVVLISFGWAQRHASRLLYFGTETNNTDLYRFPGLSGEVARILSSSGKVVGVGVDTASVDAGTSKTYPAHAILAQQNVYNLENVNLDQPCIPARGFSIYSLPMKISNGTGAPVRIIAMPASDSSSPLDLRL